jgi:hypothetical protein
VLQVFRHTMFGPEGRPQHCCAWLGLACAFPDNAHPNVPDEVWSCFPICHARFVDYGMLCFGIGG